MTGGNGEGGGGGIDPSSLHLKKELTQIRKAARVLRDPGTSSTWLSPTLTNSARSITKHHYVHHGNDLVSSSSQQFLQPLESSSNVNAVSDNDKGNVKKKRVFLYNWKSQKSESEGRQTGEEEGSLTPDESVDVDSLSDARNGGGSGSGSVSKIDNYSSDSYASAIFNCKDVNFMSSIRGNKKKPRRSNYSSASLKHQNNKLQIVLSKMPRNIYGSSLDLRRDDCNSNDSEDLRRPSGISPLLAKFANKRWSKSPRTLLRNYRNDYDSVSHSTPALSTRSYNKYGIRNMRNLSTGESSDATMRSLNNSDEETYDRSCGIPCYRSKRSTPRSRLVYGSCSPSLSDTLKRKLCGSQTMCRKRRPHSSRTAGQSHIPLLTNNDGVRGGSSSLGSEKSRDDLSTNYGELDLEALSRLDRKRWSTSCRSQEELDIVDQNREVCEEGSPENTSCLSHKHRPMSFEELIGQNVVVQSLTTAVSRERISPVYLFQGPRGTGKTSTTRIFAAALNCLSTNETKPCRVCRVCADFVSGKTRHLREFDASNKNGITKIKNLLKNISAFAHKSVPQEYKIFVIEECHLLPTKTWLTFLQLLEKPLLHVVFILVTTDIDNVPYTILSRSQKQIFNKISNGDIVTKLRNIADDENFDVELDVLELIASNADGSLKDAETMLDQLSLFGKRISVSLVKELIGIVSDEKVLELLELAMSSNTTETVTRARELMGSGVDPAVLMSQMATLIVDIIAGTYPSNDAKHSFSFFSGISLSEREIDRLKQALVILSEAEKHLRVSTERSTWFTATLLQLGSVQSPKRSHSGSSHRKSYKETEEHNISMPKESTKKIAARRNSTSSTDSSPNQSNSKMLLKIWLQCIEKCHSTTLRKILQAHGKLLSISERQGGFVAHIGFSDSDTITRVKGFLSSITSSFEIVLRHNVEVKIIELPDYHQNPMDKSLALDQENRSNRSNIPSVDRESLRVLKGSTSGSEDHQTELHNKSIIPGQKIESIIRDQRLETAWLHTLKPEKNQVLPQESTNYVEDELYHEMQALRISNGIAPKKDEIIRRNDHCPISPMHNSNLTSNLSKDQMRYESGSEGGVCGALFCWKTTEPQRKAKAKHGAPTHARERTGLSLFGICAKAKKTENGKRKL